VSWHQKGKTRKVNQSGFTGARDSEWQWHQLGHMQMCTLTQTHNHASTPPLSFYRPDAFPATQPTASKLFISDCHECEKFWSVLRGYTDLKYVDCTYTVICLQCFDAVGRVKVRAKS